MDYCNNETLKQFEQIKSSDSFESVIYLYKVFVPILLAGCLLSLILNTVLVIIGTIIQSKLSRLNRSRSPILLLSLNLAATDSIASFLMGFGLLINSFLPVVLDINLTNLCFKLILEIFRLSALIASALHLLALALVHYKGIVNPLHYRSMIFCSQHRTRSIYLMSFICWLLPSIVIASYFSSIPCQGFQHETCRSDFILTFRFRFMIVVAFFIPLVLMLYLYIKIFIIIKRHQKQRLLNQNKSINKKLMIMTIRSRNNSITTAANVNDIQQQNDDGEKFSNQKMKIVETDDIHDHCCDTFKPKSSVLFNENFMEKFLINNNNNNNNNIENEKGQPSSCCCSNDNDNNDENHEYQCQKHGQLSSFINQPMSSSNNMDRTCSPTNNNDDDYSKLLSPLTMIKNIQIVEYNENNNDNQNDNCYVGGKLLFTNSSTTTTTTTRITNDHHCNNNNNYSSTIIEQQQHLSMNQQRENHRKRNLTGGSISTNNTSNNAKALITTLSILGTYILCWMPAVLFFALTCIDQCYYPINTLSYRCRVIFSFITNGLVILKAIIDPFIYTYRMKEMKNALNRCLHFICPFDCVRNCCPPDTSITGATTTLHSTWSSRMDNNNNNSSISIRMKKLHQQYSSQSSASSQQQRRRPITEI